MKPAFYSLEGDRQGKKQATLIRLASKFFTPLNMWLAFCSPSTLHPPFALYNQIQAGDGTHASPGDESVWYFKGVCEAVAQGRLSPNIKVIWATDAFFSLKKCLDMHSCLHAAGDSSTRTLNKLF